MRCQCDCIRRKQSESESVSAAPDQTTWCGEKHEGAHLTAAEIMTHREAFNSPP